MSCDLSCVFWWLSFMFQVVSIFLYCSVIWVLIVKRKHPHLQTSFFTLCISIGIADLIRICSRLLFRSVAQLIHQSFVFSRPFLESTVFQTGSTILTTWSSHFVQVFGIVILSLNRLTAIWDPFSYAYKWRGSRLKKAIMFQWLWALPFGIAQLHPCCYSKLKDNQTFLSEWIIWQNCKIFVANAIFVETFIVVPTLVILHIVMMYKALKYKKSGQQSQKRVKSSHRAAQKETKYHEDNIMTK